MSDEKGDYQIGNLAGVWLRAHVCGSDANAMRALYAAMEASAKANAWISVKDRVPDTGRNVLVYRSEAMSKAGIDHGHQHGEFFIWADRYSMPVTHWREIPEPPVEVGA